VERLRGRAVLGWAAIGVAGACVVVACLVPAFVMAIEAYIGAGTSQRGFRYERELVIARDLLPFGLLPLAAGVFLVACAAVVVAYGSRAAVVVAAFVVAVALGLLVVDTEDRLGWPGPNGVIGWEHNDGGPLLRPGLDDLHAEARRSPEAKEPGWTLSGEAYYAARAVFGWRLFVGSTLALLWLTGFRLARLWLRPVPSTLLIAAATMVVLLWLFLRALSNMN
jgi:hypothetical protein